MKLLDHVNPLQGTASIMKFSNGNTLPLITRPFGMAAWSPQTDEAGERWFFHPSHRSLQGIRLTHQPSPWMADYGHLLLMPQSGPLYLSPFDWASSFRPEETIIRPDYFRVQLLRYRATLELAPTVRCAVIRIRFEERDGARFLVSPFEGESSIQIDSAARLVTGFTRGNSENLVPENFAQYFAISFDCEINEGLSGTFDKEFASSESRAANGNRVGAYVGLEVPETGYVQARVATSFISVEQALLNMKNEIGDSGFDEVRIEAAEQWETTLGKIQVEDEDDEKLKTFYTSLYRTSLFPRVWYEYDNRGNQIHYSTFSGNVESGPMYSDNGFWDTFRTEYPLLSILSPTLVGEMLQAWVNVYKEGGWMPKWVSPGERSLMPGTLIDAVFADAYVKGVRGFDVEAAYEGLKKHATVDSGKEGIGRKGLADYVKYGFMPSDKYHESVSNALDYYYGDFCIAQLADGLGKHEESRQMLERSRNYVRLYDPQTGFMRGLKADGSRKGEFDPFAWGGDYCEGGPWQTSWAVQHDLLGLAKLMGGREKMYNRLLELFATPPHFRIGSYSFEIHEMSEMAAVDFGQFAISNQPSFHIPYIFTAIGYPSETQYWVRRTMEELFSSHPDGLPGDEDNGSMSAWYIFGALGIYPLSPGTPEYVWGSPLFKKAVLTLENGEQLTIESENNSAENVYVHAIYVNDELQDRLSIPHETLIGGGTIRFVMTDRPVNKEYAEEQLPFSLSSSMKESLL